MSAREQASTLPDECSAHRGNPRSQPTAFDVRSGALREEPVMTHEAVRALVQRARRIVAEPSDRQSLRDANALRRHALSAYQRALDSMSRRDRDGVKAYVSALRSEAAAQRAEAKELRELLAALIGA